MTPALTAYQHPTAGFRLPLPDDWQVVEDTDGVALIAVEPARGPWFQANAVVTIEQLPEPADLAAWQDQALGLLRATLTELVLIDLADTDVNGHPARRTLLHHRTGGSEVVHAVVLEQWALLVGGVGYTFTTSVAALEYAQFAEVFAEMAGQFRPDPEYQP